MPNPLSEEQSRLDHLVVPVIYGDIFDYPLSLGELHRFCTCALSRDELEEALRDESGFSRIVSHKEGYYFLRGRDELVDIRKTRNETSKKAWALACRIIGMICYVPFIRGVLVTGSLAVNNARKKDDLDFMILTEPGRLWIVFFVLGILQRIFSKRFLCPNYYVSIDHLAIKRRSFYVAREAAQARPIFGKEVCTRFQDANKWLFDFFPNAATWKHKHDQVLERKGLRRAFSRSVEWVLGGRLGNVVEGWVKKMLKHRLAAHYGKHGQEVPREVMENAMAEVELRFHGLDHEESIYRAIEKRKDRIESLLETES